MTAGEFVGMFNVEDFSEGFPSLAYVFFRLCLVVVFCDQVAGYGYAGYLAYPSGDVFSLIIATAQAFHPVGGNWDYNVDVVKETVGQEFAGKQSGELAVYPGSAVVFGVFYQLTVGIIIFIEEIGGSFFDRCVQAHQFLKELVVGREMIVSSWNIPVTFGTQKLFTVDQCAVAYGAAYREEHPR